MANDPLSKGYGHIDLTAKQNCDEIEDTYCCPDCADDLDTCDCDGTYDELKSRISWELPAVMYQYHSNDNGADYYACAFCTARASHIHGKPQTLTHDDDCLGKMLLEFSAKED